MGGDCRLSNIRSVLVKGHSPGGSSIASLQASKKCTVAQCTCWVGYTLGSASLSSFEVYTGGRVCDERSLLMYRTL